MDAQRAEVRALEAEIAALRRACEELRAAGEDTWRAQYVLPQSLGADEGLRHVSRAPRAPPQPSVGLAEESGSLRRLLRRLRGGRLCGFLARVAAGHLRGAVDSDSGAPFEK